MLLGIIPAQPLAQRRHALGRRVAHGAVQTVANRIKHAIGRFAARLPDFEVAHCPPLRFQRLPARHQFKGVKWANRIGIHHFNVRLFFSAARTRTASISLSHNAIN